MTLRCTAGVDSFVLTPSLHASQSPYHPQRKAQRYEMPLAFNCYPIPSLGWWHYCPSRTLVLPSVQSRTLMRACGCTVDMPQLLLLFTDVPGTPVHRGGEGSLLALLQPAQVKFARASEADVFVYIPFCHPPCRYSRSAGFP